MLYNLILKSKVSFLDRMFTYQYDGKILPGTRVIVPFGRANEKTIAIVIEKSLEIEENLDYIPKKIIEVLDNKPILSEELLEVAFYMIKNNISDYSSAISTILPPGSIDKVKEYYIINKNSNILEQDLFDFLKDAKSYEEIENKFKGKYKKSYINDLVLDEVIDSYFDIKSKASIKYDEYVQINTDDPYSLVKSNAKKQLAILDYLTEKKIVEKKELLLKTLSNSTSLNTLIDKGILKIEKKVRYRDVLSEVEKYDKHKFNTDQSDVYNKILQSEKNNFLIHGITGSGKTEIYLQLVEKYLEEDKEAIILVPEISLTPQTINRFQGRFGDKIAVLHSKLSISERSDQWRLIKNKKVKIVIGARSAIFAPFENIGIIVIDEEHESSFKSEKNPKYSSIEIGKIRAKYHNAKLILGTATPSVKTMHEVEKGNFELLKLDNRVSGKKLPDIYVIDMREELKSNNFSMFSNLLKREIEDSLNKKEQSILFLNKRGHTSFVFCRSCGYVHKCEACDVAMTYHKQKDRLICHYCGRTATKSKTCKNCGSKWIKEYGAGTEMLEEEAIKTFPNAKIYRMDADTTSKKHDYDKVYKMMKNGEIDILIGTQMLAKGLDFPNVSVVGIVSADVSLNVPDYRSGEKTFGLITQVSGRAGRGNTEGKVIIQTYNPDNYAIKYASENNYDKFYQHEISERKLFNYPPIINILNINISSLDRFYAVRSGQNLMIEINKIIRNENIELLEMTGPTPSIIERINNRYRFEIIIKSSNKHELIKISDELRKLDNDNKIYINYTLEEE